MSESLLFSSYQLGPIKLKNRIVMAPMTRSRCVGNIASPLVAEYYTQRAEAGLIITEGTSPSPNGLGYARIPGLFSSEQVKAWKVVTDSVHRAGSRIFVQLMHTGRVSHPANLPKGARVLAPSALAAPGEVYTDSEGMQPYPIPIAMTEDEITTVLGEYENSARFAMDAGFDGVELHGANGYLIEQFLNIGSNQRSDAWGGSVAGRVRFAVEVAMRVATAIGADHVGMRISPYGVFNGSVTDAKTDEVYIELAKQLAKLKLLYIHTVDHSSMGAPAPSPALLSEIRQVFNGKIILSGGYDAQRANADLVNNKGELVAFGRPFISNPHLVSKLQHGLPLVVPDMATFYTPGSVGYTDYAIE